MKIYTPNIFSINRLRHRMKLDFESLFLDWFWIVLAVDCTRSSEIDDIRDRVLLSAAEPKIESSSKRSDILSASMSTLRDGGLT